MVLGNGIVVTTGVALLGGELVLSLYVRQTSDLFGAAAYGSALLLVSELSHWSLELGIRHRGGSDVLRRRAATVVMLITASLAAGCSAAVIAQAPMPGSVALTVVGIGGILAGIVVLALLLRAGETGSTARK